MSCAHWKTSPVIFRPKLIYYLPFSISSSPPPLPYSRVLVDDPGFYFRIYILSRELMYGVVRTSMVTLISTGAQIVVAAYESCSLCISIACPSLFLLRLPVPHLVSPSTAIRFHFRNAASVKVYPNCIGIHCRQRPIHPYLCFSRFFISFLSHRLRPNSLGHRYNQYILQTVLFCPLQLNFLDKCSHVPSLDITFFQPQVYIIDFNVPSPRKAHFFAFSRKCIRINVTFVIHFMKWTHWGQ